VVSIGSPEELLENPDYILNSISPTEAAARLPARRICSHKGDYGHAVIVAGSRGKSGAAVLSGISALRSGSGLVTVCTPERIQPIVSSFYPELMTEGLPSTPGGALASSGVEPLLAVLEGKDVVAAGPGLGRDQETAGLVHRLVRESPVSVVLDADGLNAFEGALDQLRNLAGRPLILTPHAGEFARLSGLAVEEILEDKVEVSRRFAGEKNVWLVLKTFRTLVAEPGGRVFVCPLGNPGMSTAGTGDVLTGTIASLLGLCAAQGRLAPEEITGAVVSAVYLHSLAGDLAAEQLGQEALTAVDIVNHLGPAFKSLRTNRPRC